MTINDEDTINDLPTREETLVPHGTPSTPGPRPNHLFALCLILGAGTWLILNGSAVFFLIKGPLESPR